VLAAGLAVFLGLNLLLYSSFFTNPQGPWDFFRAYNVWSNTGVVAHRGPWFRYFRWLAQMELPLLAGGLAGAMLAAWRRDNAFAVFSGLWAVGIVAAYSLIPYKTPWLTLNFLPPLALSAGYLVSTLARISVGGWRQLLPVLGGVVLAVTTFQTVRLNFLRYDDDRQPYVYAQTSREVLALVDAVGDLVSRTPKRVPVVVMVPYEYQFPLPWYLRDVAAGYPGKVEALDEGLAIVTYGQNAEAARVLGERFVRVGIYELRTGTRLVLFASSSLAAKN
jgi:predicted membrane-bound mannosyltransferase